MGVLSASSLPPFCNQYSYNSDYKNTKYVKYIIPFCLVTLIIQFLVNLFAFTFIIECISMPVRTLNHSGIMYRKTLMRVKNAANSRWPGFFSWILFDAFGEMIMYFTKIFVVLSHWDEKFISQSQSTWKTYVKNIYTWYNYKSI